MKKYNVVIMSLAEKDINEIFSYIANESIENANKVLEDFYKVFENLELYPFMFKEINKILVNKKDYRLIQVDNYLIFYKINTKNVYIMRIIHSKRNYNFLLN